MSVKKKRGLWSLAAAGVVALTTFAGGASAHAETAPAVEAPATNNGDECRTPVTEYKYSKEVETTSTKWHIEKVYAEDVFNDTWYSYNPGVDKADDDPTTGPINKDNGWQVNNGNHNGLYGDPNFAVGTPWQSAGGNGSWFYVTRTVTHHAGDIYSGHGGDVTQDSEPTEFNGKAIGAPFDIGGTLYKYVITGSQQVTTGTTTELYNNGDWTTDTPGDPWVLIDQRTGEGDRIPCEIPVPTQPSANDPCGADNATWNQPADTVQFTWSIVNGELIVTATEWFVFPEGKTHNYGVAQDSNEACPVEPSVTFSHSAECASFDVTVNNVGIPAGWWYGVRVAVDGTVVGSAIKQGPGTNTYHGTLAEDQGGGSVTVSYWVYASTEQDLLPDDLTPVDPNGGGAVRSFTVNTDCAENPVPSFTMDLDCATNGDILVTGTFVDFAYGDSIWVRLDNGDAISANMIDGTWDWQFSNVSPGEHQVTAEIRRMTGQATEDFEVVDSVSDTTTCREEVTTTTEPGPTTTQPGPTTTAPGPTTTAPGPTTTTEPKPVCPEGTDKAGTPLDKLTDANGDGMINASDCDEPEAPTTTGVPPTTAPPCVPHDANGDGTVDAGEGCTLPATGSSTGTTLGLAFAALITGLGLFFVSRRRTA